MSLLAEKFKSTLENEGVHYDYSPASEERDEYIRVTFSGKNANTLSTVFFFDGNGKSVNVKSYGIANVAEDSLMRMYVKLNELNAQYRWVKFYINSENEVTVSGDAIIDEETGGEECFEICMRYVRIIDECYPGIMKTLWG